MSSLFSGIKISTYRPCPTLTASPRRSGAECRACGPTCVPFPRQHTAGWPEAAPISSACPLPLALSGLLFQCSASLVENSASLSGCSSQCPGHVGPSIPLTSANWNLRTSSCHSIFIIELVPLHILQSELMPSGIHLDG